jgi:hypothetical protein
VVFFLVGGARLFRRSHGPALHAEKKPLPSTSGVVQNDTSPVLPNFAVGDIRDLLTRAEDLYEDDPLAYQELLKALRAHGTLAEAMLQEMFFEDPSDLYVGMLCDIATPFSEPFFLKIVSGKRRYPVGSSKTAGKVIELLSGLKSKVLLENLEAFRVGLHLNHHTYYDQTIYFYMAGWGESLLPFLSKAVDSAESYHERVGAGAAIGRLGSKAAAEFLYDAFLKKNNLEDLRPALMGLADLPTALLVKIVEQHVKENPKDPRNSDLLYYALQAKEPEAAFRILTWALFNPALTDADRAQALVASVFRKEPQIADIIADFVLSGQARGRLLGTASSALSSLCEKGCGNYDKIKSAVDHVFQQESEPRVRIRLIEALSNFDQLQGDPETALRLKSALGEFRGLGESEFLSVIAAKTKLSRTSPDAAGELLDLFREHEGSTPLSVQSRMESRQVILSEMASHVNDSRIDVVISGALASPLSSPLDAIGRNALLHALGTRGLTRQGRDALMGFLVNQAYNREYHSVYVHSISMLLRSAPEQEAVLRSLVQRIPDPYRIELETVFPWKE